MSKRKVPIRFSTNKHGQRRAHYWFRMHWHQLAMTIAMKMLENGDAKLMPT